MEQAMKRWEITLVTPSTSLRDALRAIDRASSHIALVTDENRRLLGTLSDGDARRGFLKGMSLDDPVSGVMHNSPTCASASDDPIAILAKMRQLGLHQIPVLDPAGVVVGLQTVDDFLTPSARDNWVVIMAGGLGSRLKQLTHDTPKPMLRVGSRPLLETILRGFTAQGFHQFYFAVNYKAEQIERHFGDGASFGVQINYLREQQRLGTAGALSLLPQDPDRPVIVTNADLLTKVDCGAMLDTHNQSGAAATMAVRQYEMQVPFGVVREHEGLIENIEEKPLQHFTVSAGINVLSPQVLKLVPKATYVDMPSLFAAVTESGLHARCHHVDGYWLDIGRPADYERANQDYESVFS
jgi:dTDP-glucose pyrophosphorylase/CBS domain-containing protein